MVFGYGGHGGGGGADAYVSLSAVTLVAIELQQGLPSAFSHWLSTLTTSHVVRAAANEIWRDAPLRVICLKGTAPSALFVLFWDSSRAHRPY